MLVQHPVSLLLVFLCLKVRNMKLSNARTVLLLLVFLCLKVRTMKLSNARKASNSVHLPLPESETYP